MRLSLLFRMQKQQPLPDLTGAVAAPLSEEAQAMMKLVAALPSSAPARIPPTSSNRPCFGLLVISNADASRYADLSVEEARARSERSGAVFGCGAPASTVSARDTTLHLPHANVQCRVYTPAQEANAALPQTLLM